LWCNASVSKFTRTSPRRRTPEKPTGHAGGRSPLDKRRNKQSRRGVHTVSKPMTDGSGYNKTKLRSTTKGGKEKKKKVRSRPGKTWGTESATHEGGRTESKPRGARVCGERKEKTQGQRGGGDMEKRTNKQK